MATAAMDYETADGERYDDEPRYERDQRSASPRPRDDGHDARRRSASPNGRADHGMKDDNGSRDGEGSVNPGSNLFVTGIHPKLTESEVSRLFEKYGEVEKAQIMRDPHTKESRGFGFVKMVTSDQADAAKDGLQGEVIEGRTLSIEKARRARPRTPTPGKYFGPPKRDGGPGGRGGRFDDRRPRGGYGGGYGGRDDPYRYRGGSDRRDYDRGYDRGGYDRSYRDDRGGYDRGYREDRGGYRDDRSYDRRDRDDGYGRVDRYGGGGRDDRYGGRGGDRDRGFERSDREGPRSREPAASGYADSAARPERDAYGGAP